MRLPNREVKEFFRKKFIDVNFGEKQLKSVTDSYSVKGKK